MITFKVFLEQIQTNVDAQRLAREKQAQAKNQQRQREAEMEADRARREKQSKASQAEQERERNQATRQSRQNGGFQKYRKTVTFGPTRFKIT